MTFISMSARIGCHTQHKSNRNYNCYVCGKQFNGLSAMNTRKRDMQKILTYYDKCGSGYKSKILFKIHEWNVHGDVYLECEKCGN